MDEQESEQLSDITWENKSEAGSQSRPPRGVFSGHCDLFFRGWTRSAGCQGHFTSGCVADGTDLLYLLIRKERNLFSVCYKQNYLEPRNFPNAQLQPSRLPAQGLTWT